MPLLHKKLFTPERLPRDLRPDEEVFVCKATQEVFRDYEKFFNRHFLCNSYVWTCSLTGQCNLTYTQALESEREAQKLLNSFPQCYKRVVLELVHHVRRTNIRSLGDELLAFFKERYIVEERLELVQTTASGAKVLRPVQVVKVIPPDPKSPPTSPVRMSVISLPPSVSSPSPMTSDQTTTTHNGVAQCVPNTPPQPLTNGLPDAAHTASPGGSSPNCFKIPKTLTPRTPLTPQATLNPSGYKYVVETLEEPSARMTVSSKQLSRPKGQLHPKKLKLFLRNALQRLSEKHAFRVKEEYVQKFDLGVSSVSSDPLPSPSPSRSRKRSLSQASLDSFLSPNEEVKRSRPPSLDTTNKAKRAKKTPHKSSRRKSGSKSSAKSKTPSLGGHKHRHKTPSSPRSPGVEKNTGKTPRSQMEALKVLNKAKKFRQMDLKKSVVKKSGLSQEELEELQRRTDEERRHLQEAWEAEKRRRREERMEKLRLTQELKRLERLKQIEMMKPREDTLCTDSKPLPQPSPLTSLLPPELFGEGVMVLEFLHSFGPLFNIREVIREGITFEKIERCLISSDTDTVLFDVVRFLMQAVFAAMEEDHENVVNMKDAVSHGEEGEGEMMRGEEGAGGEQREMEGVEVEEKEEGEAEEEKPLDIQVASICGLSVMYAQWSHLTQRLPLSQLVVDPYVCSEVLRLHLLASGGYSETANRKRFRSYRRGGYTDGDNPAIALRLRRPDLLTTLGHTSIYDLSPQDKLEILSTLCSQLLTFSVARDHIDECCMHGKRVRRKIREIQLGEERRKRESRQQRIKKRKEKVKNDPSRSMSTIGVGSACQPPAQPPTGDTASPGSAPDPLPAKSTGGVKEGAAEETVTPQETEEERRERVKEELSELHEELTEATSSVCLQPLGADRHHHRYWIFPNLPGLFVEDAGLSQKLSPVPGPPTSLVPLQPSSSTHTTTPSIPLSQPPSLPTSMVPEISAPSLLPTPQLVQSCFPEPQPMNIDLQPSAPLPQPSAPLLQSSTLLPLSAPASQSVSDLVSQENTSPNAVKWSCYSKAEEVEELLEALDVRGVREKALREALTRHKPNLLRTIDKCVLKTERKQLSPPATQTLRYDSGDQYLELYLREQLLDTEEKIHLGNLGHLRGCQSREEWRNVIENSGAAALVNSWREKTEISEQGGSEAREGSGSREDMCSPVSPAAEAGKVKSSTPTSATNPSVRMLSQALLDVEAGLEPKFLMPPLGNAVDNKKHGIRNPKKPTIVKETDICRDQWRASLTQATSFSQLFLHLATLERAIMWSRSLMNVRCRICRRKGGDEYMLLCDGCDHGYHTYCLKPPLSHVPEGDWFCHNCSPVTPVKPRKRTQHVTFQEVESSESEGEEEGEGEEERESEEEEEGEDEEEELDEEEVISTRTLRSQRGRPVSGQRRSGRLHQKYKKATSAHTKKTKKIVHQKAKKQQAVPAPTIKAKKKLNLDTPQPLTASKVESIVSAIIELRCSRGSRGGGGGAVRREQRGLEMQLCQALWEEVNNHDKSWPFTEPVKKKEYPDYHDIVSDPIDLRTIRSRIKRGDYLSLDDLVADMELMFANCRLFHRRHSEIGKAGLALKKFFDKRCSDLGLKDLELVSSGSGTARLRSSHKRK